MKCIKNERYLAGVLTWDKTSFDTFQNDILMLKKHAVREVNYNRCTKLQ